MTRATLRKKCIARAIVSEVGHGEEMVLKRLPFGAVAVIAEAMRVIPHARTLSALGLLATRTERPPRVGGAGKSLYGILMFKRKCKQVRGEDGKLEV